jgi:hypothetical protein
MYESRGDIRRADTADILMRWDLGPYSCTNLMISVSSLGQRSFSDFRLTQGLNRILTTVAASRRHSVRDASEVRGTADQFVAVCEYETRNVRQRRK